MSVLKLVVPSADFSAVGLGRFAAIPEVRNSLYAAYVLATDFATSTLRDVSGHGRDAVIGAGAVGTKNLLGGSGNYAICPFTGADIAAANGEITLVAVCNPQVDASHGALAVTNYSGGSVAQISLGRPGTGSGSTAARTYAADGTTTRSLDVSTSDSHSGTDYEMMAGVYRTTRQQTYRKYGNLASTWADTGVVTALATLGGAGAMRLGYPITAGQFTLTSSPSIVAIYNKALTQAELDAVYAGLKTLGALYSVNF